jgi:hypothetical protein
MVDPEGRSYRIREGDTLPPLMSLLCLVERAILTC